MNFVYIIFSSSEINKIVLSELLPFSAEPIRLSSDKSKCYAKYIGDMPSCLSSLSTKSKEYSSEEIQPFLESENWNNPVPF